MMKFGFFGFPHLGGTYSVFRNLRQGLAARGVDLRWLSACAEAHAASDGDFFRAEQPCGDLAGRPGDDPPAQARALSEMLLTGGFKGVIVNVLADAVETNIARYLPLDLLRVMMVHNITPGTYAAAAAIRDHVHMTVAISPRMRNDLVARYGFRPERLQLIPHGVATPTSLRTRRPDGGPIRILSLGRIDEQAKGVFWLPAIYGGLTAPAVLTIAGDGPDLPLLRQRLARFGDRIKFVGSVAPDAAQRLFASHDIFLMPSRFEGFGMVLVEAMAAGCVPVASRIVGVTDAIVGHHHDGYLFPVGDTHDASAAIDRLANKPSQLRSMSRTATASVRDKFGLDRCADAYSELFMRLVASPPLLPPPCNLAVWDTPPGLRKGLRTYLPEPVKNLLREWRERLSTR